MGTISLREIEQHHPDLLLPPDEEFANYYGEFADVGLDDAKSLRVAFVAICRNAMPFLPLTMQYVQSAGECFEDYKVFVYENDSTDGTKDFLSQWSDGSRRFCSLQDNGRPHLNSTKHESRTMALAEYRNECRKWVDGDSMDFDYVIVFDTDPWGGFSVGGILNTIGRMDDREALWTSAMASYSWCEWGQPVWSQPTLCQYDAWACRWTGWKERKDMLWFHLWHPPVGSPPVKMNSAFGQLAVYREDAYLRGVYRGGDCEHVAFHKSMGGDLYLNPSMRCVSFWIPEEGARMPDGSIDDSNLHDDVLGDVDRRDADPDHQPDAEDIG
jgi:hypothetical protein